MEVHLSPQQQERLRQLATKTGTEPDQLAADVLARYLDEEEHFLAAVAKGIEAAQRGEFIDEEEMDRRIDAMFPR